MNMRGPPRVRMVQPRICSRLDCEEAVLTVFVRDASTGTIKIGIQGRAMLVNLMMIAARRVGLPDFDQCMRHRPLVFVQNAPDDNEPLPYCFPSCGAIAGEVVLAGLHCIRPKDRTCNFRKRLLNWNKPLERCGLHG